MTKPWMDRERDDDSLVQSFVEDLYRAIRIFMYEFHLDIPEPMVGFVKTRQTTLALYSPDLSDLFGRPIIYLNIEHLDNPLYRVMRWILHECLHISQELHGKPSSGQYHNKQYIDLSLQCGILVDHYGHDLGHLAKYSAVLRKYGLNDVPKTEVTKVYLGKDSKRRRVK